MAKTSKNASSLDYEQAIQGAFNDVDYSVTTAGFLTGKIGRKIVQTIGTTSVVGDTADFSYYEGATLLYTIRVIYTDDTQTVMVSSERIA